MEQFLSFYRSIEVIDTFESSALSKLLRWMLCENRVDFTHYGDVCKAVGSMALSLYPTRYFVHENDLSCVLRKLLRRYVEVSDRFLCANAQEVVLLTDDNIPHDIFTADAINTTEMHMYGVTASGAKLDAVGTVSGWAYHFLLNGMVHPLTREPLLNLGKISLGVPMLLDSFPMLSRSEVDLLIVINKLYQPPAVLSEHLGYAGLKQFESLFGIPNDRALSLLVLDDDEEFSETESIDQSEAGSEVFENDTGDDSDSAEDSDSDSDSAEDSDSTYETDAASLVEDDSDMEESKNDELPMRIPVQIPGVISVTMLMH